MSSFASTDRTLNEHLGQYQASASEPRTPTPSHPALNFLHFDGYQMENRPHPYRMEIGRGQQGRAFLTGWMSRGMILYMKVIAYLLFTTDFV